MLAHSSHHSHLWQKRNKWPAISIMLRQIRQCFGNCIIYHDFQLLNWMLIDGMSKCYKSTHHDQLTDVLLVSSLWSFFNLSYILQVENVFFRFCCFFNQARSVHLSCILKKSNTTPLQKHLVGNHPGWVAFNLSSNYVLRNLQLCFQVNCNKTSAQFLSQSVSRTSLPADHWVVTRWGGEDANRKWSTSLLVYDQRLSAGGRHRAPLQPYAYGLSVGAPWSAKLF